MLIPLCVVTLLRAAASKKLSSYLKQSDVEKMKGQSLKEHP